MILRPNGELSCMNVYINDLTKGEKVISLNVKNIYILLDEGYCRFCFSLILCPI